MNKKSRLPLDFSVPERPGVVLIERHGLLFARRARNNALFCYLWIVTGTFSICTAHVGFDVFLCVIHNALRCFFFSSYRVLNENMPRRGEV